MARKVLITAGASGIGKEIAKAFSASGDTVFVCDIDILNIFQKQEKRYGLIFPLIHFLIKMVLIKELLL